MADQYLSIANFNVQNLVSPNVAYYGSSAYTQTTYDTKLDWCAQQLQRMNADIVIFQEVFHTEALQDLCSRSKIYADAEILSPHTGENEPRVALVSQYPIDHFSSYVDVPKECQTPEYKKFRRPPLRATITVSNDISLNIFALHLKSKRPEFLAGEDSSDLILHAKATARSLQMRAMEAIAIRHLVLEHNQIPTMIIGDLNDSAQSVTTGILMGPKPLWSAPEDTRTHFWKNRFFCASDQMIRRSSQDVAFTYIHDGHYQTIDQVLLSDHFHFKNPNSIGKLVYLQFFNDHLIDRSVGRIPRPPGASDHGQIVAHLQITTK